MKNAFAALVLVFLATTVGCASDPHVDKGGGESAVLEVRDGVVTGRIDVRGHVVNTGGMKARDVELFFKFLQGGTVYLEGKLQIGDLPAGESETFSGSFFGPPVDPAAFTWEYRIDWE